VLFFRSVLLLLVLLVLLVPILHCAAGCCD